MNSTGYIGLVDTDRTELRERIAVARRRFDASGAPAAPDARVPRSEWTVQQTVAHVLTVAHRYRSGRSGRRLPPRRSSAGGGRDQPRGARGGHGTGIRTCRSVAGPRTGNGCLLRRARRSRRDVSLPPHDRRLGDGADELAGRTAISMGTTLPGPSRRAGNFPNAIWRSCCGACFSSPRHGCVAIPAPPRDMCVTLEIHGARPYLIRIHGGRAEIRERRAEDRPDAVLKGPASVFTQLLYQRTGPLVATLRGLRIVGGRRPWLALRLQSCFERP